MAANKVEALLAVGESLAKAQTHEHQAAEAYRLAPDRSTLKAWLEAVREMELLTLSYMDATMHFVDRAGPPDRMPAELLFRENGAWSGS